MMGTWLAGESWIRLAAERGGVKKKILRRSTESRKNLMNHFLSKEHVILKPALVQPLNVHLLYNTESMTVPSK